MLDVDARVSRGQSSQRVDDYECDAAASGGGSYGIGSVNCGGNCDGLSSQWHVFVAVVIVWWYHLGSTCNVRLRNTND